MTPSRSSTRSHPRRGLIAGLLMALALGGLGPAPQARAAPDSAAQTVNLTVSPASIKICKGQTGTVKVTATVLTSRSRGGRPSRQPPETSVLTPQPPSIASVSPASAELTFRNQATVQFRITGNSVGDQNLTFHLDPPDDVLAPLVGPAPAPARAAKAWGSMTVSVRECKYLLVLKSKWNIARAWNYDLSSRLRAELVPDANGSFAAGAIVENTHTQRIRLGGPCSKTPTIETTRADVDGTIDNRSGKLDFKVKYDPVRAAETDIKCTTPVGIIGALGHGTGAAQIYNPQPVIINAQVGGPGTSVSGTYPHDLHTDLGNVQTNGQYTIKTIAK